MAMMAKTARKARRMTVSKMKAMRRASRPALGFGVGLSRQAQASAFEILG